MKSIPIGETFEVFVNWLKDTFRVLFDLFSSVLDFSISLLENVILLNYQDSSAIVIFGLILSLLLGVLAKRFAGWKAFIAVFILSGVIFGALESWRKEELNRRLTPELASTMAVHFNNLVQNLESQKPADFSEATDLLISLRESSSTYDIPASRLTSYLGQLDRSISSIGRARDNDFEAVADELAIVVEQSSFLKEDVLDDLKQITFQYETFILIEDSSRMLVDLEDAQSQSRQRELTEVLNLRS